MQVRVRLRGERSTSEDIYLAHRRSQGNSPLPMYFSAAAHTTYAAGVCRSVLMWSRLWRSIMRGEVTFLVVGLGIVIVVYATSRKKIFFQYESYKEVL